MLLCPWHVLKLLRGCLAIVGLVWNSLGNKCKDEARSHSTLTSLLWLCLELKRTWESFYSTYLATVYINFCAILEYFLLVVNIFSVFLWSCICLNLGLPKTNPASGQTANWTRGPRISSPAPLPLGNAASYKTTNYSYKTTTFPCSLKQNKQAKTVPH